MSKRTDIDYLKNQQYHDAQNLNARIELHRRFSTNPGNWFRWVFDHLGIDGPAKILEVGCGPGVLWKHNLERIPLLNQIYLSDFSSGMLHEARTTIPDSAGVFRYIALDAQAVPFPNNRFDLVIANHMLYHVPKRQLAFAEIHRVLKPGGKLVAATNGINHMLEIHQYLTLLDPGLAENTLHAFGISEFTIENGSAQLQPWFEQVDHVPFIDCLEVTEVEPLIAYIISMTTAPQLAITPEQRSALYLFLKQKIRANGSIHITKSTALFIARKSK